MEYGKHRFKKGNGMHDRKFYPVNISEYFNNDGISYDNLKNDGAFDGHGATYPAEELPMSNSIIKIDDIPFYFPNKEEGARNNLTLRRQTFSFPANLYKNLLVLGASESPKGKSFREEAIITFSDGDSQSIHIGLSNWLLYPVFNERLSFGCSHVHNPDRGQSINRNFFSEASFVDYEPEDTSIYKSKNFTKQDWDILDPKDWKPKIWFQKVVLPTQKAARELSFENGNLNFHIFCMTLELL